MTIVRKAIKVAMLFFTILSAILFVGCCASSYISPAKIPFLAVVNLGFPLVLFGNLFWLIFWLMAKRKLAWIPSIALLLGGYNLFCYFSWVPKFTNKIAPNKSYTVMTYNVKNFDLYNWSHNSVTKASIMKVIKDNVPDILCLQEFYSDSSKTFNTLQELGRIYPYHHFWKSLSLDHGRYWGQATFSKYPILKKQLISFEGSRHNLCLVSDIQLGDSLISIYNVHLQSYHFDNHDYEVMEHVTVNDATKKLPLRKWYKKLSDATKQRAVQADILAGLIKNNPNKVVLCGDFNDSPNAYAYHKISNTLHDTFLQAGWGIGQTYNGPFPSLRIDYVFVNPSIMVLSHKVLHQGSSDHYPVLTQVGW